jgi:chromosome segregation ATPase
MTSPIIIETELGQALAQINQKLDNLQKDVTDLKIGQARLEEKLTGMEKDITEVRGSQKAQIWTLIGVLTTAVIGTVIRFVITALPGNTAQ